MDRLAFNVADLAEVAGIGKTTAYHEAKAGRLVLTKIGRRTVVLADDLERYLAARRAESIASRQEAAV